MNMSRRVALVFMLVTLCVPVSSQAQEFIVPEYLASRYTAPPAAPSTIVVAGTDEPGQRLVVTGRTLVGQTPVAGYEPLLLSLQFDDDPIVVGRRKFGIPLLDPEAFKNGPSKSRPDCVLTRPVTRDARGIWRVTRDIQMVRE